MNFFHHKDLGNHLLQLCPKVVKHPVYIYNIRIFYYQHNPLLFLLLYIYNVLYYLLPTKLNLPQYVSLVNQGSQKMAIRNNPKRVVVVVVSFILGK